MTCVSSICKLVNKIYNPAKYKQQHSQSYHNDSNYSGLQAHKQDMQTICDEMNMDSYIIHRLDVCLDTDAPYEETQKLTRLIALLLGMNTGMDNRYISIDPITFEPKTIRLDNAHRGKDGKRIQPTLQVEHYNRELIDQTAYTGTPIINRFELRAMGAQAGKARTEGDIIANWIERLDGLTERDIESLCQIENIHIAESCGRYAKLTGVTTKTAINYFIRSQADHIYTRNQLVNLLDMLGRDNPKRDAGNLLTRSGRLFKRYRTKQIMNEIDSMKAALIGFLWANKMTQK